MAKRWMGRGALVFLFFGEAQGASPEAPSFSFDRAQPASLKAEEVVYDRDLGLVIARGNVEIVQGKEKLQADTVTYNQKLDAVTASGHVRMINARGDVAYAHYTELEEGMKKGFIQELRILQKDESRFSARKGERRPEGFTVLEKVFYSPCQQCKADPQRPLTWDIRADRVVLDEEQENVSYEGAVLRLKNMPIAYLPWLTHPSPRVKQRSGFLMPRIIPHNRSLGTGVGLPYFVDLSPSHHLILNPFFFSQELPLMSAKYGQKFRRGGALQISGSYIKPDRVKGLKKTSALESYQRTGKPRWHLLAHGRYHASDQWRLGTDVNRLSDQTYYRHYPLFGHQSDTILDSTAYAEYFQGHHYGLLQGEVFQNLTEGSVSHLTPRILPRALVSLLSDAGSYGERWRLEMGTLSVYRSHGMNIHRFSSEGGILIPYISPQGQEWKFRASLVGDGYYKEFHPYGALSPQQLLSATQSGVLSKQKRGAGRVFPKVSVEWKYPFARVGAEGRTLVSPLVTFTSTPRHLNKAWIPNEDSRDFEFDDRNILQENRFSGRDRVDSGTRFTYGMDLSHGHKRMSSFFVGQSYSLTPSTFSAGSGLEGCSSDYVARIMASPWEHFTLMSRGRFDRTRLQCRWNESSLLLGPQPFYLTTQYLFYGNKANTMTHRSYHIWKQGVNSQLTDNWFSSFNMTRDLTLSHQLSQEAGIRYKDDCFQAEASVRRQFFRVPGIKPGLTMMVSCDFRNLGDVSYKRTLEKAPTIPSQGGASLPFGASSGRDAPGAGENQGRLSGDYGALPR